MQLQKAWILLALCACCLLLLLYHSAPKLLQDTPSYQVPAAGKPMRRMPRSSATMIVPKSTADESSSQHEERPQQQQQQLEEGGTQQQQQPETVPPEPTVPLTKAQAAMVAIFAADSYSLAYHWVYDVKQIPQHSTKLEGPHTGYHPNRKAGEYSPYGDQALVMLKSVYQRNTFDLENFASLWLRLFNEYDGYIDGATRGTLTNFRAGRAAFESGSGSHDFSAVARVVGPLLLIYERNRDLPLLKANARIAATMTHNHRDVLDATEFIAHVAARTLDLESPEDAIREVKSSLSNSLQQLVGLALDSKDRETPDMILRFGQACYVNQALPGTIHAIIKHPNNLTRALQENLAGGGDTCARANVIALILGSYLGRSSLPAWTEDIRHFEMIEHYSRLRRLKTDKDVA